MESKFRQLVVNIQISTKRTTVLHNQPWRKYRIGIHSEPIRTIPIHSDICIQANPNHSEPIRKMFCNSFDEKR